MKAIIIIPARGGSKRIPKKNLVPLAGKPLIAHTLGHALKSRLGGRVFVTTDDEAVAIIARQYGAEVITRPPELSTDTATSESALLHVLEHLEKTEGANPDFVVFLQCTSPLRGDNDIDNAIRLLEEQGADSVFSASKFNKCIWERNNGLLASLNYDYKNRLREQDFQEQYHENGSIYVTKTWVLKERNNRVGGKIAVYEMNPLHSFQIDIMEDRYICECVIQMEKSGRDNI
jgi:CMP-N,N'-diacetyllegionaminic acid synthase